MDWNKFRKETCLRYHTKQDKENSKVKTNKEQQRNCSTEFREEEQN